MSQPLAAPAGFHKHSITGPGLFFLGVGASAPMTVVVGGLIGAYASSSVSGVPVAIALLTIVLLLCNVGYMAVSKHVRHAGPLYAHVARGLGPRRGLAAATVSLLSYNAIQVSLYGLVGATMESFNLGHWWVWALVAWAIIATFGVLEVTITAKALAILLAVEVAVVVAFVVPALIHPTDGALSFAPLAPTSLLGDGQGAVLALAVACFVGYETPVAFSEEASGHRTLVRASFTSLIFMGILYTAAAWAIPAATGVNAVNATSAEQGPGIVFGVLQTSFGVLGGVLGSIFLVTSIFAAMLSFHQTVARYLFTLTRERLLPRAIGRIGRRTGAPVGGSLVQSGIALAVVSFWAVLELDPMILFTTLSALAAVGIMSLLAACCVATMGFFRNTGDGQVGAWTRVAAPLLGAVSMSVVVGLTVTNLHSLVGVEPGSVLVWLPPIVVAVVGLVGFCWGTIVAFRNRDIAAGIGAGEVEPLAVLETHVLSPGTVL